MLGTFFFFWTEIKHCWTKPKVVQSRTD